MAIEALSFGFTVSNGLRQEGVVTPLFFDFYTNELSIRLKYVPIGCCFAGVAISDKVLHRLLDLCLTFCKGNYIWFNRSKSKLILFDTIKYGNYANILVECNALNCVSNFNYLGNIIDNKLNDKLDKKNKERMLYGRSKIMKWKFYVCSAFVKHKLFSAFCSDIYLFPLSV